MLKLQATLNNFNILVYPWTFTSHRHKKDFVLTIFKRCISFVLVFSETRLIPTMVPRTSFKHANPSLSFIKKASPH